MFCVLKLKHVFCPAQVQSKSNSLKCAAALMAMKEFALEGLQGMEHSKAAADKLAEAAKCIKITLCEHSPEDIFCEHYQEGENADHEQMQFTNDRFTNRAKILIKARLLLENKKGDKVSAAEIVALFKELEKNHKIKTTIEKNKVQHADDVTRIEKLHAFLQGHHLVDLYEKLEWSTKYGKTPFASWTLCRNFLKLVGEDPSVAKYVMMVMEKIIYDPKDPVSRLDREMALSSVAKLEVVIKALVLQYKYLQDLMKQLEARPIATEDKMKADFEILKMCFDLPEFHKLQKDTTGKVQNLMQPAQKLHELCVNVISQKHYTTFSEAQQNNSAKEEKKTFECSLLAELCLQVKAVWSEWEKPWQKKKKEESDDKAIGSEDGAEGTNEAIVRVTRKDAKQRVAMQEINGFVKSHVFSRNMDQDD